MPFGFYKASSRSPPSLFENQPQQPAPVSAAVTSRSRVEAPLPSQPLDQGPAAPASSPTDTFENDSQQQQHQQQYIPQPG
jgi:hypothetical protein